MNDITVVAAPLPFSNKQITGIAQPGSSVGDIIDDIVPERYFGTGIDAIVEVNGWIVPVDHWDQVRPKPGTIVNVRIVPQKGQKNPLATILSIAVLIAAPALGAALANVAGFGGVWVGSTFFSSASIYSAAIGVVGKLLISALAPPPKPSNSGQNIANNPASSPTQFIEGASNAITPFGVVPICLGTNRMFPLQAAQPYTETIDNKQFVRQLFTYGVGDKMVITDPKIGDTSTDEFENIEMEHRLNGDLNTTTGLYPDQVKQDDYSVLLKQVDGYTTRTTRINTDEAIIDVTFPQGLCQFNSSGQRIKKNVVLECQFAQTGVSPQVWSTPTGSFKAYSGDSFVIANAETNANTAHYTGTRTDTIAIDRHTGVMSVYEGFHGGGLAAIPSTSIALAYATITTTVNRSNLVTSNVVTVADARNVALFGTVIQTSSDFTASVVGTTVTMTGGGLADDELDITANMTEALRISKRIRFPSAGQYDIRIRRITTDASSSQVFDKTYLTAVRSINFDIPVRMDGINGTAIRIQGTDQLNGTINQFNVIASNVIADYNDDAGGWSDRVTSNPASLYRFVLQSSANAKALDDDQIDVSALESWHSYCTDQGYSYNRVIDYDTSVDEILRDIAAAGSASPAIVDGLRTVVVDQPGKEVKAILTPRNSWGYNGQIVFPTIPHAFRVQFRNKDKGYSQDERIVYADGYDSSNATRFEVLELQSCTDSDLAFKTGRRHLAAIELRPETHQVFQHVENLTFLRGDRVTLEHDVPLVGVGDARIKSINLDGNSPAHVVSIVVDDTITIPDTETYYVRIRKEDGTFIYEPLTTTTGETTTLTFATPIAAATGPEVGNLLYVVQTGQELDLLVTLIEPADDLTARISGINYNEAIFTAESSTIPPFESNVTVPLSLRRPSPPQLALDPQSDESVMLRNSDGSYTTRAIFTLINPNDPDITATVAIRTYGSDVYHEANVLESSSTRVILTGLQDGKSYDVRIFYQRPDSKLISAPLEILNWTFVGASTDPDDVANFAIAVSGSTALLKWDANDDIDIAYYTLKYSSAFSGVTWATAQLLEEKVYENRLSVPFQGGTYLIKAVDILGNESVNATVITTYDPGVLGNAVALVVEEPTWAGVKTDVFTDGGAILIDDPAVATGYYYFANMVDLGAVYTSAITANIQAHGSYINNLFTITDIFAEDDIFGMGGIDLFGESDIMGLDDVFGIGTGSWNVTLEYRITQTDPSASPAGWGDWTEFVAGNLTFWAIQFRLVLESLVSNVTPRVTVAEVTVDMPDRIERGDNLSVPPAGTTIIYPVPFKANPSLSILIQNGDEGDQITFTSKDASGFTFKVYNTNVSAYVTRTYDYIASGYGRQQ